MNQQNSQKEQYQQGEYIPTKDSNHNQFNPVKTEQKPIQNIQQRLSQEIQVQQHAPKQNSQYKIQEAHQQQQRLRQNEISNQLFNVFVIQQKSRFQSQYMKDQSLQDLNQSRSNQVEDFPKGDNSFIKNNQNSLNLSFSHQALKRQLEDYDDLDDQDFEIIQNNDIEEEEVPVNISVTSNVYMNQHKTIVPIGIHFQADLPPFLRSQKYLQINKQKFETIRSCRISDPLEGSNFQKKHRSMIEEYIGGPRNYEDIMKIRKYHQDEDKDMDFQFYLANNSERFQAYFAGKETIKKELVKKKKKRNKGSIPIRL